MNRYFVSIFLIFLFSGNSSLAVAASSSPGVEIFANGEQFGSLKDYKFKKIKETIKQKLNLGEDELQSTLDQIQADNPQTDLTALSEEDLDKIIEPFRKSAAPAVEVKSAGDEDELSQMRKCSRNIQPSIKRPRRLI